MRRGALLWGAALILTLAGCGAPPAPTPTPAPLPSPTAAPPPAPSGPLVKTDWSVLDGEAPSETARAEEIGRRWYKDEVGALIPSPDYGPLVPYAGERLGEGYGEGFNYGLMTMDGTVVVDPVYSRVSAARYGGGAGKTLPLYLLRRGWAGAAEYEIESRYAVAARDGSWCTDFDYEFAVPGPDGVFLVAEDACLVMDTGGEIAGRWTWADLGYPAGEKPRWSPLPDADRPEWLDGLVPLDWADYEGGTNTLLNTRTGEVSTLDTDALCALRDRNYTAEGWTVTPKGDVTVLTKENGRVELPVRSLMGYAEGGYVLLKEEAGWAAYGMDGKQVVPAGRYEGLDVYYDGVSGEPYLLAADGGEDHRSAILNPDGTERLSTAGSSRSSPYPILVNGLAQVVEGDVVSYYRGDGTCVFRKNLGPVLADE